MAEIKVIKSSDDNRIGRIVEGKKKMPKRDVFGNEWTPPVNFWEPGFDNVFFVLPARPLVDDENAQLVAMGESLKSASVPTAPNSSESFANSSEQSVILPPPDFESMDVSADELKLKSEEPTFPPPAPRLNRREK